MAIIPTWCPPSREHWELLTFLWQFFPVLTLYQWFSKYYPMGKTSTTSAFNVPGKIGWATMEAPGFITLLYLMYSLPKQEGIERLPFANWTMAALFTIHYTYRALISPLFLNPSMSPIHLSVWASALSFQLINATCIGGWLGGYGPTTKEEWTGAAMRVELGLMIFGIGLLGNMYHDDELREIRRAAARNQKRKQEEKGEKANGKGVDKVYMVPENGLFRSVLFPHYLCEWIEWGGFWMVGGLACVPARSFLVNEITTMLPRALSGKQWYIERFGKEKIGSRKAVIPGII
ncbi:3-oxo-5-alpha-steroid 4-dehydrogenase-like protein [Usnea florida]